MCSNIENEEQVAGIAVASQENEVMNQNDAMTVDYSEYVEILAKKYANMLYEEAGPENLERFLGWNGSVNLSESDSFNWMLEEEKCDLFEDMDWEEYRKYEDMFIEIVETELWDMRVDWEYNYGTMVTEEYQNKLEKLVEYVANPAGNIGCLERVRELYDEYIEELGVIGIGSIEDNFGLGLDLSCLGGDFEIYEPDLDSMKWQRDYLDQRIVELEEELDYLNYKLIER